MRLPLLLVLALLLLAGRHPVHLFLQQGLFLRQLLQIGPVPLLPRGDLLQQPLFLLHDGRQRAISVIASDQMLGELEVSPVPRAAQTARAMDW